MEPDRRNFGILLRNSRGRNIATINAAISDYDRFSDMKGGDVFGRGVRNGNGGTDTMTFGKFMERTGMGEVSVLKIDTEGHELPILGTARHWIGGTKAIFMEAHSARYRDEIIGKLEETHVLLSCRRKDISWLMKFVNRSLPESLQVTDKA